MAALPCNQAAQSKLLTVGEPGGLQNGGPYCVLRQCEPANTGRVSSQAAVAEHKGSAMSAVHPCGKGSAVTPAKGRCSGLQHMSAAVQARC